MWVQHDGAPVHLVRYLRWFLSKPIQSCWIGQGELQVRLPRSPVATCLGDKVAYQYILSLLLFMVRNKNQFLINSEIYHIDTRQHANFHQPSANMTKYQKGVYYLGVKVFSMLPSYIKTEFDNSKKFKMVLQKFLYENSLYSLDEYFELQKS